MSSRRCLGVFARGSRSDVCRGRPGSPACDLYAALFPTSPDRHSWPGSDVSSGSTKRDPVHTPPRDHVELARGPETYWLPGRVRRAVVQCRGPGRHAVSSGAEAGHAEKTMRQSLNVVWYRFRATFRGQWSGYLTVIALVALLGGLAMGAVAGARRTQSFYPHYLAGTNPSDLVVAPNVPGASVSNLAHSQTLNEEFGRLPYVKHVVDYTYLLVVPLRKNGTPNPGSTLLSAQANPIGSADGEYFNQDRVTVIEGRMADPKAKNEFVTDATLAHLTGWHVGQVIPFGAYRFAQASSSGTFTGKLLRLNEKLVGIVAFNNEAVVHDDVDRYVSYALVHPRPCPLAHRKRKFLPVFLLRSQA